MTYYTTAEVFLLNYFAVFFCVCAYLDNLDAQTQSTQAGQVPGRQGSLHHQISSQLAFCCRGITVGGHQLPSTMLYVRTLCLRQSCLLTCWLDRQREILPTFQIQKHLSVVADLHLQSSAFCILCSSFCILHPVLNLKFCCVSCSHLLLHQWRPDPFGGSAAGDHS